MSWDDAQAFLQKLNGRLPGAPFVLPTEAQWEFAARAGTTASLYGELDAIAWYRDNAMGETHVVHQKRPNAWGLYDMLGNVWEWCLDGMRSDGRGQVHDPIGDADMGAYRVLRGGGWSSSARYVRAACRRFAHPSHQPPYYGFRLSRDHAPGRPDGGLESPSGTTVVVPSASSGDVRNPSGAGPERRIAPASDGGGLMNRRGFAGLAGGAAVVVVGGGLAVTRLMTPPPDSRWREDRDAIGRYADVVIPGTDAQFRMRWIEPGRFLMGSMDDDPEANDDEKPRHEVTLTDGFWLADTECTQAVYKAVMGTNPLLFQRRRPPR